MNLAELGTDERDIIDQQYERSAADMDGFETPKEVYAVAWVDGFNSGIESASLDLDAAEKSERLAIAYRGLVLHAWSEMHKARRSVDEARRNGEGTLMPQRMADAQELGLRALLLVRKQARL